MNFSSWGSYSMEQQAPHQEEIQEQLEKEEIPLSSCLIEYILEGDTSTFKALLKIKSLPDAKYNCLEGEQPLE